MSPVIFNLEQIGSRYGWDFSQLKLVAASFPDKSHFSDGDKYWFAGGALRRPIVDQDTFKESDFDVFFSSEVAFGKVRTGLTSRGFDVTAENQTNTTLTGEVIKPDPSDLENEIKAEAIEVKIQLIRIQYYENVSGILDSFDFTLCQFAYDPFTGELICGPTALYDVANKRIVVHKINYPVASFRRLIKYTKQGFYACTGAITEFLKETQQKDLTEKVKYID